MACSVCGVKSNINNMSKVYFINAKKLQERDLYTMLMFTLAVDKAELLRAFNKAGHDLTSMTENEEEETMKALSTLHEKGLDTTQGFDVFKILQNITSTKNEIAYAGSSGKLVII
jgi:phosphoribosylaminoimidazole (AIR) synthetase